MDPSLLTLVSDRPGHDRRYSVATRKIKALGWSKKTTFDAGMKKTVRWYSQNEDWWRPVREGRFKKYYRKMYSGKLKEGRKL